jgi:predicted dehydrogenase
MRPYNPIYTPFKWRGWWDFGTGALGDIGCHAFDPVFRALKLGQPLSVEATSSRVNDETFPLASMVTYHFPQRGELPPLKLVWYDGGLRPQRPSDLPEGEEMGTNGRLIVGDKGYLLGNRIFPEERRKECGEIAKTLPRSPGHYQEWADACRGGAPAGSNFDWAAPLAEVVLLGNIALRPKLRESLTRTLLLWDPLKFEFPNLPEANQFLKREYREGWSL